MLRLAACLCVVSILAFATPVFAQSFDGSFQPPAPVGVSAPVGAPLGSIEFMAGFAGQELIDPDNSGKRGGDLELGLAIIPSVEQFIANTVAIGAEMMFLWVTTSSRDTEEVYAQTIANQQDASGAANIEPERRLVLGPHGKIRMRFKLSEAVFFDSMLAVGASILTEADDRDAKDGGNVRMGWSLRFGFGVSAALNSDVDTFMNMGYYTSSSYGDALKYELSMVPLSAGLRARF